MIQVNNNYLVLQQYYGLAITKARPMGIYELNKQIKKYFAIENQQQVEVQLLGEHSLTCRNLKLRVSVVNSSNAKLHVQQLTLNSLSVTYSSTRDQPLKVTLDGAKLVLAFNPTQIENTPTYAATKEQLKMFFDGLKSKQVLHRIGFFSEEIGQLKNLIGEFFIKKISLSISNVDVSLQYSSQNQIHAIGFQLGEINIKQRTVIDNDHDGGRQSKQQEIICSLKEVSLYLGISAQEDRIQTLAYNREILRKTKTIRKNYLIEKEQIQIFYSILKNTLAISLPQLTLRANKLILVQLSATSNYLQEHLSQRPLFRPGKGELQKIRWGNRDVQMHQGTIQWWRYGCKQIIERVAQESSSYNILFNYKYRLYIFYLIYKYTYGSNNTIDKFLAEYQEKKLAYSIMNAYSLVLGKIAEIRQSQELDQQLYYFIKFVCESKKIISVIEKNGLKKITYEKIKKSSIYFNMSNCNQFIKNYNNQSALSITFSLQKSMRIELYEDKYDKLLLKQGFNLDPPNFYNLKAKYIKKFYKKMTQQKPKWQKPFFILQIQKPQLLKSKTQLKLGIPSILALGDETDVILKINNIMVYKENKNIYTQQNKVILSQKNYFIKIDSIFLNIYRNFIQHLLTVKALLTQNAIQPLKQQQQFQLFLQQNIYKRLPKHPLLEKFSEQYTNIEIDKTLIITSAFQDNQFLVFDVKGISYSSPTKDKPSTTSAQKISVSRSTIKNIQKLKNTKIQKLPIQTQSIIVENNKPLVLTSTRTLKQNPPFVYYESLLEISVPFILIQLSFQDVYYMQLLLNYWNELFNSQYLFPIRKSKTQTEMKVVELKCSKLQYFQKWSSAIKSSITRLKLEGIQLIFYGQNKRIPHNEILTTLFQGLIYQNKVYIMRSQTSIAIVNIFIENCLGSKTFNHLKFVDIITKANQYNQPLIYNSKYEDSGSSLLLYGLNETQTQGQFNQNTTQDQLIKIQMKTTYSPKKFRKITTINTVIKPIFLFHSSDFYRILTDSFGFISVIAMKNFKPTFPVPKNQIQESDHQILEAKNVSQKTVIQCSLQKLNLIVLHQNQPIYTISFLNLTLKNTKQSYTTKLQIGVKEFYIVDISPNCGFHPIVIKASPLQCQFLKYQSQLLKRKQKKSALLRIDFHNSEIYYLNRKIKQLTNFIMSHFQPSIYRQHLEQPKPQQQKPQTQTQKTYPFCYRVQFIKPVIMLLRSSLSAQKLASEAENILISNYSQVSQEVHVNPFGQAYDHPQNDSFESCIQIKQQQIQFHSFLKQNQDHNQQQSQPSQILVQLKNFYIYTSVNGYDNAITFIPDIMITLVNKHLSANIDKMDINFTQEDYVLLIRITEENFSETPVSYPKDSVETEEKEIGFKSSYFIAELSMSLQESWKSLKFGELFFVGITGDNILYTNGQKQDIIYIVSMQYESCLNNSLQKIIQNKQNFKSTYKKDAHHLFQQIKKKRKLFQINLLEKHQQRLKDQLLAEEAEKQFYKDWTVYHYQSQKDLDKNDMKHSNQVKQQTNLDRIGKWIGGMCKKCMCCCKKSQHAQEDQSQMRKQEINQSFKEFKKEEDENIFNLDESHIQNQSEVISFSAKVNPDDYLSKLTNQYNVYMHIKGQKSKQKKMYMLTQHLNIYYQKNQHIMSLINFMNKPYSEPQKPHYLKQAKFNNYRPFQMLIEVSNTSIFVIQKETITSRHLEITTHAFYNLQKIGDPNNGPGKKIMETDLVFDMAFWDSKTQKRTPISNTIRLTHQKQSVVAYHNKHPVKIRQKIVLSGFKKQQRKQELKTSTVSFNFPVYIIKSLNYLVSDFTGGNADKPKKPEEKQPSEHQLKPKINQHILSLQREKSIKSKHSDKIVEPIKQSTQSTINSTTIKKYFIPKIQLHVETKQNVRFITLFLENTYLKNQTMLKHQCQMKKQSTEVDVYVDYWNLNLGKFQPFIQKCKFMIEQHGLKKGQMQNQSLKVISKSEKDKNSNDYKGGLCVNLTTAFFHTYKELQLKYMLENEDLQTSNQICYDLSKKKTSVYEIMKKIKILRKQDYESEGLLKKFPQQLKNFFGRNFKVEDINQLTKKKSKKNQLMKNRFHIEGLKVFLYHSYLQSRSKLKFITYRTPFRIYNKTQQKIQLKFIFTNMAMSNQQWEHNLFPQQYYSIPEDIYQSDFLISIIPKHKKKQPGVAQSEQDLGSVSDFVRKTMSVKYLIQMHGKKDEYHEMEKHKLHEYIFNLSILQNRWIDKRDMIIMCGKKMFTLISIKSQCEEYKDKTIDGTKIILYDSLTIIISPIIIYNYASHTFNLTSCHSKKHELAPLKSIQLNEFPRNNKSICIQFLEDPSHRQYTFLQYKIGIHIQTMLIDRTQSVNLKIIKQTYNTCLIQIYPDWLIINQTDLDFSILSADKGFIISPKSRSSLALKEENGRSGVPMKIKLIDEENPNQPYHKFGTDVDLMDIFTLAKTEGANLRAKKKSLQKGCCGKIQDSNGLSFPSKANQRDAYKCVDLVVKIQQSPNFQLTKTLTINYKYWIVNAMNYEMFIYQSKSTSDGKRDQQDQGIQILNLAPKQEGYLYSVDFLPKQFYVKIKYHNEQYIYSNIFPCSHTMGKSISLKLKRSLGNDILTSRLAYHQSFHHVRVDLEQINYSDVLTFSYIDGNHIKYPFYINNTTNYLVKITENKQSFKIRPKTKIPFSWSKLVDCSTEIQVQIEGQSSIYSLKQKSLEFQPIVIKGDGFGAKAAASTPNKKMFKREKCMIKWKKINTQCLLVFDLFSRKLHINSEESFILSLDDAEKMSSSLYRIELFFKNREIFEFQPSPQSFKQWSQLLKNNFTNKIIDKIYFNIETQQNSMIYLIHNLQIDSTDIVKVDHKQFIIQNFFISIINSNPLRVEQIVLINMQNIEYILDNRISHMKQQDKQQYHIKKSEQTLRIKKLKINNQLKKALNPVILSQIKKSNYPFLEIRREKQNIVHSLDDSDKKQEQHIEHYKSSIFFLDEAELSIEAALIPQIINYKKAFEHIQSQYQYEKQQDDRQRQIVDEKKRVINKQIYIDYLQIKPIKMTISVSFDANIDKEVAPKFLNFLSLIPSGVENAIITIDSFIFHHVFMEQSRLKQTLKQYYIYQTKKQILFNATSIKILAPFQLIKGVGVGVKSIFYNPLYELVSTKQINSLTSNMLEGLISFFVFLFSLGFSLISGFFKFFAFLTFDDNFQTKRQMFRKQIFKSPMDGFSNGARYFVRIIKQFFLKFTIWPFQYHSKYPCIGFFFGFFLSIINIIPWLLKIVITLYDFFYVIGLGFISWGYYEQNSMKYRSRPIRTFPHKQLLPYDYLTSKGNEIMRKNLIQQNDNQEISFISHIQSGDQSKYLLLSNYRILYCSHQLTSFKEITLYNIARVFASPIEKGSLGQFQNLYITVTLNTADKNRFICLDCSTSQYDLKFRDLKSMKQFLQKLQANLRAQNIQYLLVDDNIKNYQDKTGRQMKVSGKRSSDKNYV